MVQFSKKGRKRNKEPKDRDAGGDIKSGKMAKCLSANNTYFLHSGIGSFRYSSQFPQNGYILRSLAFWLSFDYIYFLFCNNSIINQNIKSVSVGLSIVITIFISKL